jgi:hypothetical protein
MKILQRLHNIWNIGELEITPLKKEQISNIINEPPRKMAEIIKMRDEKTIINELLNEK